MKYSFPLCCYVQSASSNCTLSPWGGFGECSKTCGGGIRVQTWLVVSTIHGYQSVPVLSGVCGGRLRTWWVKGILPCC